MKPIHIQQLSEADVSTIIQMAWEDRTSFEAIRQQFGLTPGQVIAVMRQQMKPSSFRLWRARTTGRKTKHPSLVANSDAKLSVSVPPHDVP